MEGGEDGTVGPTAQRIFCLQETSQNVARYDRTLFNTNNKGDVMPADYHERGNSHNTRFWIDKFHANGTYHVIKLPSSEIAWLREAAVAGVLRNTVPHALYREDIDDLCALLEPQLTKFRDLDLARGVGSHNAAAESRHTTDACAGAGAGAGAGVGAGATADGTASPSHPGWFLRSETVSFKRGLHGPGPYKTVRQMVESICTADFTHSPLPEAGEEMTLYLMPWQDLDAATELRVFVHGDVVTAMSQQHLYNTYPVWQAMSQEEQESVVRDVLEHFRRRVQPAIKVAWKSYSYDVVRLKTGEWYFIEPNGFGARYSAGSSLFEWEYDEARLTNTRGDVFFKYVIDGASYSAADERALANAAIVDHSKA